jgi:outer membrane protein assembly factor BamB
VIRIAILVWLISPTLAFGQSADDPPDKVSNDQPSRPLQMPPASSEAKEAFDDFERFARRGVWERATKALYAIPEAQAGRFVDGQDGFIIPVARKRRAVLAGLSPQGQAAYRLFYDADAKKLLDQAEGPAEQATLERIFSVYFLTSVGDNAADRLGDLYFEQGRFDRAADCWLAVLRERTDSELSPALMAVKAALALARAGRRSEIDALRRDVADRYADEVVTLGGLKAKAAEHLKRTQDAGSPRSPDPDTTASDGPTPDLAVTVAPAWQLRFAATVTAGMTPPEVIQWDSNALSGAVPPLAIEGTRLFANYLGHIFALDIASGKMLWRSASFHNAEVAARQDQMRMLDPGRFAILTAPGYVLTLSRDPKDMNFMAPFRLTCRRAESGDVLWQSSDMSEYSELDLVGLPILGSGTLFIAGKSPMQGQQRPPQQFVLAIRPHDGKLLWKTEVGTYRLAQQFFYYGMRDTSPHPRLIYRAGSVYIDTHAGVLARLDAETGGLEWGFGYQTEPVQGMSRFFFFGSRLNQESTPTPSVPQEVGDTLLIKGAKSERLCAIDPDRMKILWDRPIARSARLIGADEGAVYLAGPELGALDRQTRVLRWSTTLPGGSDGGRMLVRSDGIWQFTPRGIFELDPRSGRVRRIFRGDDTGSSGGDLLLTDRWLLAVSNRTISAYPRGSAVARRAATGDAASSKTRGLDD